MPQYNSVHTGQQVDEAVDIVLGNKSKGDNKTPVYLNANGEAVAITKDTTATQNSANPITSGGAYTGLSVKLPMADIDTNIALGTSDTKVPSCGAVQGYIENVMDTKQDPVSGGIGINVKDNVVSVDTNYESITTIGDLDNKWEYLPELEEGNGDDLVAKMEAAKRSTFDLSKFTVVGSPSISADGVASGFSSSNYLTIPNSILIDNNVFTSKNYKISTGIVRTVNDGKMLFTTSAYGLTVFFTNYNRIVVNLSSNGTSWDIAQDVTSNTDAFVDNKPYIYTFERDSSHYYVKQLDVETGIETTLITINSTADLYVASGSNAIIGYHSWYGAFKGSIDLKQFSITVDGVEVFSGNKTGIDTIKPDDYTVVGTPTISADGVASGFSSRNYLTKAISFGDNAWDIYFDINLSNISEVFSTLLFLSSAYRFLILADGRVRLIINNAEVNVSGENSLQINTNYLLKISFNGNNKYSIKITNIDTGASINNSVTNSNKIPNTSFTCLIGSNAGNSYLRGSIDLNSFKIYVDGNLVYQPCLKIPYTLTSQGNKIVDVQYKDRVEDEEQQAGYTPYDVLETEITEDFTKVGNVSIVDGIASGFSASNYLTKTLSFNLGQDIEIYGDFTTSSNLSTSQYLFALKLYSATSEIREIKFIVTSEGKFRWVYHDNSNFQYYEGITAQANTKYYYKVQKVTLQNNNVVLRIYYGTDKNNLNNYINNPYVITGSTNDEVTALDTGITFRGTFYWTGSIDLNSFKIYVDGKLVYTPYKKPYYELSTIKESNLVSSYTNSTTQTRKFANQFIKQQGACTASTAVTLPTPFQDTNYFLSVPYSAKTKTGFTPTATGDWIAEGYTSL